MIWQTVEDSLETLEKAKDGYSSARRGIVTLPDETRVFVKIGVDENTNQWAKKEIAVYEFLSTHSFNPMPKLISYSANQAAFALEPLEVPDGWNWKNEWSNERLQATLAAMDELARLKLSEDEARLFSAKSMSETSNGWKPLSESKEKQALLRDKLVKAGYADFVSKFDIQANTAVSMKYVFINDSLVHNDVRADNCAWNPGTQQVKLIDWNWLQVGDRRIDINAMLVDVYKSGFDVVSGFADRLDSDALQWLGGFWLNAAATPIKPGGPEHSSLRDYQLESGVAALRLRESFLERVR